MFLEVQFLKRNDEKSPSSKLPLPFSIPLGLCHILNILFLFMRFPHQGALVMGSF